MGAIATRPNRYHQARKFAGLTRRQAAELTGIPTWRLQSIEEGPDTAIAVEIQTLARAYGIDELWLRGVGPERLELDQVPDPEFRQDLARLPEYDRNQVLTIMAAVDVTPSGESALDVMDAFRRTRP